MYYVGPIVKDSFDSIRDSYHDEITHLTINSNGGSLVAAIRIGFWLKRNQIPVTIDAVCLSACVYMALGSPDVTVRY